MVRPWIQLNGFFAKKSLPSSFECFNNRQVSQLIHNTIPDYNNWQLYWCIVRLMHLLGAFFSRSLFKDYLLRAYFISLCRNCYNYYTMSPQCSVHVTVLTRPWDYRWCAKTECPSHSEWIVFYVSKEKSQLCVMRSKWISPIFTHF